MATFDQLSDEQRAILELLLRRGQSYKDLSGKLDLPEGRVRELARDALVELAPVTARGVDSDWRGQLSDYVLGQQAGPESTATRGHLRRSEAARSWARSLLDSLDGLYGDGVPSIPDAERGGAKRAREAAPVKEKEAKQPKEPKQALSPEAAAVVRRRRLIGAGSVLAVLILVAVLLWPIGVLTGSSSDSGKTASSSKPTAAVNKNTQGQAVIATQAGKNQILVSAVGLAPSTQKQAYQVWLYNSQSDAKSLGFAAANSQGQLQGGATLPANYRRYKFIDISREPVDKNAAHSGDSVLRGVLQLLKKPVAQGSGKTRATIVASIRLQPLPQSGG
jgi:Na+-transporting methylmalonyl-CoA/oxaloacetate decarboxylase gamma subunit